MSINYSVSIEAYAERHYVKSFSKKYKSKWDITLNAIIEELKRFDSLLTSSIAETIVDGGDVLIVKTEFRIATTNESRKSSGNRCIIAVHKKLGIIKILLVYNKTDLSGTNETAEWKRIIKENYKDYEDLL